MVSENTDILKPVTFPLGSIGESSIGYVTIAEDGKIPFTVKRVYWTYHTPHEVVRGHHSHKKLHQLIFAVKGVINFKLEHQNGETFDFILNDPSKGIYIPPGYWREIRFSHDSVLLCLASEVYDETDYIRNYEAFKNQELNP